MNKKIKLLLFVAFQIATFFDLQAQDFGVKGSTPTVFLIGGGFQYQLDNLNWGDLPIESNVKDHAGGVGLHVKVEMRKYFGTSGFYFCPNLKMSIGMTTRNNREMPSLSNEFMHYFCLNSYIIPAIGLGYDLSEYWALYLGVGYWDEFVFGPKFYIGQTGKNSGITKETNGSGKIAVIVGVKSDGFRFDCDYDFVIGLGNPFKTVDAFYHGYHFQLNSPFLLFTVSLNKKFQKY